MMPEDEHGNLTPTGQKLLETQEVLLRQTKIIIWVAVILFITAALSVFRAFQLVDSVEELEDTTVNLTVETSEAREASVDARDSLEEAIAELEARRTENVPSAEIAAALQAVARIEQYLCGGPCPEQ